MGFRFIDTTADVGIEVWGSSLKELFEESARGLFQLIADTSSIAPKEQVEWETEGLDIEDLLISMLNDMIFLHDAKRMVFKDIKITDMNSSRVRFKLTGEKFDPSRHRLNAEIKAATYHNIKIEEDNSTYKTRIVFDV